jgi:hypothetical protein
MFSPKMMLPIVLAASLAACTQPTACPEIACDPSCSTVLNEDGCIARCECPPPAPCDPVTPSDVTANVTLTALRGPGGELAPQPAGVGTTALVSLATAGLSTNTAHHALLQSVANGVRLLGLDGVDAALGTLPASLEGHIYAMGEPAAFGTKAPALLALPQAMGGLHAVAVGTPESMTATGQSQAFGLKLVEDAAASPPVPAPIQAGNQLAGFPSGAAAVVEGRYLYVRNDATNTVDALDLTSFSANAFQPVATRSFATSAQAGLAAHFAGALTPTTNPANGALALAYTDLGAPGAGLFVYNPSTLAFSHHRLPAVGTAEAQDITALAWSPSGAQLYATVDHYTPSGTFDRISARLYVLDVVDGATPSLRDARSTTTETDPTLDIRLPLHRPVRVLPVARGSQDLVLVLTLPNDGEGALHALQRGQGCTVERLAVGNVGMLVFDSPSLERLDVNNQPHLFMGTQAGVQVWRGAW